MSRETRSPEMLKLRRAPARL